jgi:hypothetical protein
MMMAFRAKLYPLDPNMNTEPAELVRRHLMNMRIVVAALATGVLGFVALVIMQRANGVKPLGDGNVDVTAYIGYAALAIMIGLQPIILGIIESVQRKKISSGDNSAQLLALFQARTVIGCALIEGASFMCVMASMLDGQPWGLIAGGLGAAAMLGLHFPTLARYEAFAERLRGEMA